MWKRLLPCIVLKRSVGRDDSDSRRKNDGNKMAMTNIRQRFELAYGSRASVDVDHSDDTYTVTLRFPVDEDDS